MIDRTAHIVKEIFKQYLELGSIGKVKKYLIEQGYKMNRGKEFTDMSIRNILKNEFYIGKVTWNELEVSGQHEAIINKITFGKVQSKLERQNKRNTE
ncbi:recombinase family protein [Tumebacillus lipolyticus]|uniref:Recombinase family protein n=1 Tax=Tumebacillus lipolyticus TaxID=1280370 RepID=A0ABW4ZSA6_9BACL